MIMVIGSVPEWKQDGSVGPNMELVRELRGREVQFPVIYFWRYPVIGNSCILRQIWVRQTTEHVPLPSWWPCWQALNGPQWYDIFGSSIQYALILRSYNNICGSSFWSLTNQFHLRTVPPRGAVLTWGREIITENNEKWSESQSQGSEHQQMRF